MVTMKHVYFLLQCAIGCRSTYSLDSTLLHYVIQTANNWHVIRIREGPKGKTPHRIIKYVVLKLSIKLYFSQI